MNETGKRDLSQIPAGACVLSVGEFELGDNGDGAKTAPVRLVARSGKAIEHWFWGRVVHDLAGMHLHKSRVPIDYVHDAKEIVGYLNKFDRTSGDLVTSGALVPFKDSDRATEIVHKMKAGVPYEASINFGGDGIKVEDVPDGMVAQVNGYQFDGPGIIVREWPLRGVAICPYGADANTESAALAGANAKTYTATAYAKPNTEESDMKADEKPVEVAAQAEAPAAVETEKQDEAKPVEETHAEAAAPAAVEATAPEGETVTEQAQAEPEAKTLSRDEVTRIADEFGADVAIETVRAGGDYQTALHLAYSAKLAENETLRGRVAELTASLTSATGRPVPVTDAKPKKTLRELCEQGTR
jgi:hypothetical protein